MKFASVLSTSPDLPALADELNRQLGDLAPDLLVMFVSGLDREQCEQIAQGVRAELRPTACLACTAESVIGAKAEIEQRPAVSLVAAHLPGVRLTPFAVQPGQWQAMVEPAAFERVIDLPADSRAVLLLADPFSTPIDELLETFNTLYPGVPLIGGMASGAARPGGNVLILDGQALNGGAVGVALSGALAVDVVVSQGCRPVGAPLTVTEAERNLIHSLENQPPVETVQALYTGLAPDEQRLMHNGLFIGRAIKPETGEEALGRGDFLVRGVLGIERQTGALAVSDFVQAGETIQFHVRDAETAKEDLEMMLTPHSFGEPPAGALLFSCNGRGTRLYDHPNGDIRTLNDILGVTPLAGFFCAGELGPIGGRNFLHSHTASLALFRPPNT